MSAEDIVRRLAELEIEVEADGTLIFVDFEDADRLAASAREWVAAQTV